MEDFYTRILGFAVTDRGGEGRRMVFLSAAPGEHHQIVLAEAKAGEPGRGSLDHLAFRVDDLKRLRAHHARLKAEGGDVEMVSHGTTWSVYFRDPEGNRLELFVDTPWHVAQPVRFAVDLGQPDDALIVWTEKKIAALPGFQPRARWLKGHRRRVAPKAD